MRASTIRLFARLWLMILLACAGPLHAQGPRAENMDRGSAELVAESAAAPGGEANVAIRFEPLPGWHGYWTNPGDAGRGLTLEWQLPAGWSAGEPQFPVPQRLTIAGLMNHVFEGEHAVLVPIDVPASAEPGRGYPIAVYGEWLTCSDTLCVPQWATLRGEIRVAADTGEADPRFAQWRASIPPQLDSDGRFELTASTLRLAIPVPASMALQDPHVFVETLKLVDYAAPQVFRRTGDWLVAEIPLKGGAEPEAIGGILALGDGNGVRFVARPGEVPGGGELIAGVASDAPPLWTLLLGALAGGLLLNIMPCVFPILSIKALSLARAGESQAQARREGLAYTAGVVLACVALGAAMLALRAAGEQVGWAFQLQSPGVVVFLLLLAVGITANFAGVFELPSLSMTRSGEPASAFSTGLLAAFVATPCTGPFMAAALGAALLLPPIPALVLFAALGLGLALPFLLIGLVPALRSMLPKPGAWMAKFRKAMAIPMGLTALALVWLTARLGGQGFALFALVVVAGIVIALLVVGRLQRAGKLAWPAFGLIAAPFLLFGAFALPSSYQVPEESSAESIHQPQTFSEASLAEARASGRPVFLWFTADWCVTCKVNESVAIEREATKDAFEEAGVISMVGDWTRPDPAITAFLNQQGAAGVPLYLWYEPGQEGEQLPQVLTAEMLIEKARR
ncbi:protein-disulfide reductase DsbD family protein [Altererythrobacter arenosus]|uniref:Protein-disulfide reductase DsbD family protein n=1 Tax=Altererythrobacter arenosus TaxID=3032592 RepID=A0ABY8FQQ8_9SPHN|nr:protein-disulfide reductase DsbD domain-containing protein [Altererythrobacter sp. CAU 1644]WFL76445.1 protein-disulfide reductase DsbD family protein [Altererythrobacter sp. CAU 1644]